VERKHRHLDRETDEESPEHPLLHPGRKMQLHQLRDFEGVIAELVEMLEIERQDAEQHQYRAGQGIQEKFDRRVELARAAPHADDEVHRHQHQFPEDVEQEEVERDEDADHARLEQQEHRVVFLHAFLNGVPRAEHGEEAHQRGEQQQQQADAVDADVVAGAKRGDPIGAFHELETGQVAPEMRGQGKGDEEAGERHHVSPHTDQVFVMRRQKQQDRQAHDGRPQNQAQ